MVARQMLLTLISMPPSSLVTVVKADKIVKMLRVLYDRSSHCVRVGDLQSSWFKNLSSVPLDCVLAPDSFATIMDWLLERSVGIGMNGMIFGLNSFTDLYFVNDICLFAEFLDLLIPVLEMLATQAASLS